MKIYEISTKFSLKWSFEDENFSISDSHDYFPPTMEGKFSPHGGGFFHRFSGTTKHPKFAGKTTTMGGKSNKFSPHHGGKMTTTMGGK